MCLRLFQRFCGTAAQEEAENVSSLLGLSCFIAAAPIQTALTQPQAGRPQLPVTYFDRVLSLFFFFLLLDAQATLTCMCVCVRLPGHQSESQSLCDPCVL